MPAPLSLDIRQLFISAYQTKEGSQRKLANSFGFCVSFFRELTRRYRQTGTIEPKPHGGGAVAKIEPKHLPIVKKLVDNQPDALLFELCERFAAQTTIQVSTSTMQRAVQSLKLSVKKNVSCF
jgi:transposase